MQFINLVWLLPAGYLIGMLLNHLADTLPTTRKITLQTKCAKCGQTFDIVNYITLKRCSHCMSLPNVRRYVVILISLIGVPAVYFLPPAYTGWPLAFLIFTYLGLVFIIDFEHRLVLHSVSLVGGVLFVVLGLILNGWKTTFFGLISGFGIMYVLYLFGLLFSRYMARKRGQEIEEIALGFGDVTLSTILGLLLGWPRIGLVLFFAILLGGVFSGLFLAVSLLNKKYQAFTAIPYAPFIIISAVTLIYMSSAS
jgi:leader peptidase (prepilin peptidase)/N-methyltransferase